MLSKLKKGSGIISLNGAAAFKGNKNDLVIICTYCEIDELKVKSHKPKLIYLKENKNDINEIKSKIPVQKKTNIINIK